MTSTCKRLCSSAAVKPEEMKALLAHCRERLARLAGEIINGNIAVNPYRLGERDTPCSHCDLQALCRFDFSADSYRNLPTYSKREVLDMVTHG